MKKFSQYVNEERKTTRSHPFYVYSPDSFASYRKIGRFKTEKEAQDHVKKIKPHMSSVKLVVGQGAYPK